MGKRCRLAALGATFALLVAACAATEAPRSTQAARLAERGQPAVASTVPESLANADDTGPDLGGQCLVEHPPRLGLVDLATGDPLAEIPLPHDVETPALIVGTTAYLRHGWGQMGTPGLVAVDLADRAVGWHTELPDIPESVAATNHGLIVVSRDGVRSLDPDSGAVRWHTASQFDYAEVEVTADLAFAIDTVAVHAIDLRDGTIRWQLPIDRAEDLAAGGSLLAVAAGSRVVAIDTEVPGILWEQQVDRAGAGDLRIGPDAVIAELSPTAAPAGGVIALDRATGLERWRIDAMDEAFWAGPAIMVTSFVPADSPPGVPYVIGGIDVSTGERIWAVPSTATAQHAVLAVSPTRALIADPHPGAAGVQRLRLLDVTTGSPIWETASLGPVTGGLIDLGVFVTLYRTGEPADLSLVSGSTVAWESNMTSMSHPPTLTSEGIAVVSDHRTERCVARQLGGPATA